MMQTCSGEGPATQVASILAEWIVARGAASAYTAWVSFPDRMAQLGMPYNSAVYASALDFAIAHRDTVVPALQADIVRYLLSVP